MEPEPKRCRIFRSGSPPGGAKPRSALDLAEVMVRGAVSRGEGCAITATEYATAVLYNGLGQYELALEAAEKAAAADEVVTSSWALYELVEAASRCGRRGGRP